MKKSIVVIMALITIFSASVTAFASSGDAYVDGAIVDTLTNVYFDSYNCSLVYAGGQEPSPNMTGFPAGNITQKTTYRMLYELYERCTVYGSNLVANKVSGTYEWIERNGYCFIVFNVDSPAIPYGRLWVGNFNAKILYCDAPTSETTYDVSAIAGASTYFITPRPVGTAGNGYLGDLYISRSNYNNIKSTLNNLGGATSYYTILFSVNGETRYYLATAFGGTRYFVCNSAGQLFYTLKEDPPVDDDTGVGSTFDPSEVITAINSVYDAILSMSSDLGTRITNLRSSVDSFSSQFSMHMDNTVFGFESIGNQLSTLNSYFTDLSGLFPVQETITLLGSDTRVAWDSADRITNVTAAGFNGDLIVKERPGDLVDESGYEKVTINETEYSLYNDNNGYRRIKANNEYEGGSNSIPEDTLFFFPFEDTLASSVGEFELTSSGTPQYTTGISGNSYLFNGSNDLSFTGFGIPSTLDDAFTFSYWFYPVQWPSDIPAGYRVLIGDGGSGSYNAYIMMRIIDGGVVVYTVVNNFTGGTLSYTGGTLNLNSWNHIAFTFKDSIFYMFANGNLEYTYDYSAYGSVSLGSENGLYINGSLTSIVAGCRIDDLLLVNGTALWTSSFNPQQDAILSVVVKDYFLPCSDQEITLNFYDTEGEQVTEYRWNQYTVNTSRLPSGYTEVEYIRSNGSQYVNSGFNPNQDTRVVMDVDTGQSWLNEFSGLLGSGVTGGGGSSDKFLTYLYKSISGIHDHYDGQTKNSSAVNMYGRHVFDKNKNVTSIDGTVVNEFTYSSFQQSSPLAILTCYDNGYVSSTTLTLYSCRIYDNGTLVRDFVPCKNPSNAVGLYDLVNGQFYGNSGTGSFTAGAEVSNGSGIGQLVGVVSSTNRNAYPDDGEQNGFYYEYIGAFTEYPSFSQTLSPADVNGNAITMGRLEDDFSEIYMDISTMMWYCHDPQTQTEILLSSANQEIMNDTIYVRQNYTTLPADQITADALQNLLPVDSPVYLDMPEGAKLTITYDHYTGWFRMMYILMDKQTKLLSDLDIVSETIINVENTVIDITNNNPAYNVFYITKTDGTTESVGDAAKDAAVFVGDILSMFYRLVFDDALDNAGVIQDFEDVLTTTNTGVNVW